MALLSVGRSDAIEQRARHLDIEHCRTGVGDKQSGLEQLRSELAMTREQTAFLGNDLNSMFYKTECLTVMYFFHHRVIVQYTRENPAIKTIFLL